MNLKKDGKNHSITNTLTHAAVQVGVGTEHGLCDEEVCHQWDLIWCQSNGLSGGWRGEDVKHSLDATRTAHTCARKGPLWHGLTHAGLDDHPVDDQIELAEGLGV